MEDIRDVLVELPEEVVVTVDIIEDFVGLKVVGKAVIVIVEVMDVAVVVEVDVGAVVVVDVWGGVVEFAAVVIAVEIVVESVTISVDFWDKDVGFIEVVVVIGKVADEIAVIVVFLSELLGMIVEVLAGAGLVVGFWGVIVDILVVLVVDAVVDSVVMVEVIFVVECREVVAVDVDCWGGILETVEVSVTRPEIEVAFVADNSGNLCLLSCFMSNSSC